MDTENLLKNVKWVIAGAAPNARGSAKLELRARGEGRGGRDKDLPPLY